MLARLVHHYGAGSVAAGNQNSFAPFWPLNPKPYNPKTLKPYIPKVYN